MFKRFDPAGRFKGWFFAYKDPLTGRWREKCGGMIKTAAKHKQTKLEHDLLTGKWIGRSEAFLSFCSKTYLLEQKSNVSRDSYLREEGVIKNHFAQFFNIDLHVITPELVSQYKTGRLQQNTLAKKPVSGETVRKELRILHHIFELAVRYGKILRNPVDGVDLPEEAPGRIRYLTEEELKAWPNVMAKLPSQMRPIISLLQYTGMRRSEVLRLNWEDIDLERGFLILRKDKRKKVKVVPLNDSALLILKLQPRLVSRVFPCVDEDYLTQSFREACSTAGIVNFRLHDLRHNFASHLAMSGTDIATLRDLLGHSDTRMTSRYTTHLSPGHLKKEVGKLDEIFSVKDDQGKPKGRVN